MLDWESSFTLELEGQATLDRNEAVGAAQQSNGVGLEAMANPRLWDAFARRHVLQ